VTLIVMGEAEAVVKLRRILEESAVREEAVAS